MKQRQNYPSKIRLTMVFLAIALIFSACWESTTKQRTAKENKWENYPASSDKKSNSNTAAKSSDNSEDEMNETTTTEIKSGGFTANLPGGFNIPNDAVGNKMIREYGAVFAAKNGVTPPDTVVFKDELSVSAWQSGVATSRETIGGITIELQTPAMNALKEAISEAGKNNLDITPRGEDAARRNYNGTVELWASRVNPGLTHWVGQGKLSQSEANRIKSLSPAEQIPEIFRLEEQGMYFAKDLSKSIIYSVAPPGTSQHISMLAFDVTEHENPRVREILARHGWFQTVNSDLPHFTFLGVQESRLPDLGLKKVSSGGRIYWIPKL